jgi:hypothetical protein
MLARLRVRKIKTKICSPPKEKKKRWKSIIVDSSLPGRQRKTRHNPTFAKRSRHFLISLILFSESICLFCFFYLRLSPQKRQISSVFNLAE